MLSAVAKRYGHHTLYKVSHSNHPCTIWAGDRYANWLWLINHSLALNDEKIHRTGKSHASAEVIKYYLKNNSGPPEDELGLSPFALAMPDQYKDIDAVKSYQNYYLGAKQFFKDGRRPVWTKRSPPEWWKFAKV